MDNVACFVSSFINKQINTIKIKQSKFWQVVHNFPGNIMVLNELLTTADLSQLDYSQIPMDGKKMIT